MKILIDNIEIEGLEALMGQKVTLMCGCYFYTGKLIGVNDTCVKLSDAAIVYETGPHGTANWTDSQPMPGDWYVQTAAIESFGVWK